MAKRQGLDDIIRDAISAQRPKRKLLPKKLNVGDVANDPLSSIQRPRRREQGSYRDQLSDANRFGGKRPERKIKYYLMSNPPIAVYNDGSRVRGVKPSRNTPRRYPKDKPAKTSGAKLTPKYKGKYKKND
jgi:hypothetical protein